MFGFKFKANIFNRSRRAGIVGTAKAIRNRISNVFRYPIHKHDGTSTDANAGIMNAPGIGATSGDAANRPAGVIAIKANGMLVKPLADGDTLFATPVYIAGALTMDLPINGKEKNITADVEKGYLILKRVWENDEVELVFTMKIRKIYANLKVREDAGCVAFMRGPIVYCFEGVDNPGLLQSYHIFEDAKMEEEVCKEGLLEGCVLLKIKARKLETVGDSLYSDIAPVRTLTTLTAVPYYTWGNRGENQMRVWMRGE